MLTSLSERFIPSYERREGGEPSKRRDYLLPDKQFLITRNGMWLSYASLLLLSWLLSLLLLVLSLPYRRPWLIAHRLPISSLSPSSWEEGVA